jgi:hypothetical protein
MLNLGNEKVDTEDGDGRRKTLWRVPEVRSSILLIQIPTNMRAGVGVGVDVDLDVDVDVGVVEV